MRPFKDINIGDIYKTIHGSEWGVMEKDNSEKMIKVIMISNLSPYLNKPIWKKNADRIFNNRIQIGRIL